MINRISKAIETVPTLIIIKFPTVNNLKKDRLCGSATALSMKAVGSAKLEKVMDYKYGPMEPDTKAIGTTIRLMGKADLFMLMEIFTTANGETIKHQARVHIIIIMGPNIQDNGWMISSTAMVFKLGLTDRNTKDFMTWEGKMGKENTLGEMVVIMMAVGKITKLQEQAFICGQTEGDMKGNG